MNILNCTAFRCVVLPSGTLQLELENPRTYGPDHIDPFSTKLLRIPEIAKKLGEAPATIQRWSNQKHNRLPLARIPGKRRSSRNGIYSHTWRRNERQNPRAA